MATELNHTIVPASDPLASARFLAGILGLEVSPPVAHFTPVSLGNQVTLDYDHADRVDEHRPTGERLVACWDDLRRERRQRRDREFAVSCFSCLSPGARSAPGCWAWRRRCGLRLSRGQGGRWQAGRAGTPRSRPAR